MNTRIPIGAAVLLLALTLAGCSGSGDSASPDPSTPPTSTPLVTAPPGAEPTFGPGDEFPSEQARQDAHAVLGMYEQDLPTGVRVARRGSEQFALTDDYKLGRITVELDDAGEGFRVMTSTVELPDGPETFELIPS